MTLLSQLCPNCKQLVPSETNIEYSEQRTTENTGIRLVIAARFCNRDCLTTWLMKEKIATIARALSRGAVIGGVPIRRPTEREATP